MLDALEALSPDGGHPVVRVDDALRRRQYEHLPAGGLEGRTRAMLKVEDGCVNFCTYCVIPYARGPVRSLPLAAAAAALEEQASRLTEAVAVFRIQQQQQQQRETSAVVKTVTPAAPRKMAVADSEKNWETF